MPTITITATAAQAQQFAADLGIAQKLTDNSVPPKPRSATAEECKQWLIQRAEQLHIDVDGAAKQKAALAAVTVTPLGLT